MNNATASIQSANGTKFFDGIKALMTKITSTFKPKEKEKPKFSNVTVTEAIEFVEWRTKYDQKRITNHVRVSTALVQFPELCTALGINTPPTYMSERLKSDRLHGRYQFQDGGYKFQSRTRELLLRDYPERHTVTIETTDNSFERRLVRWFGNLNPETKLILDGKKTKYQRWARKNARIMDLYLDRISEMLSTTKSQSLNGYEQQLLKVLIEQSTIVRVPTAQIETVAPIAQEKAIEVVAGTLPTKEVAPTPVQSLSKRMTIKELKAYAKVRKIHVPGRITKHRDIYDHIKSQLAQA